MFLKLYAIALPIFFAIDLFWLGVVSKNFYRAQIGSLMSPNVNWLAAILFYLLFIVGLVVFVIQPSVSAHTWTQAVLKGALFGLVCYATYDLTNLAVAKDWSVLITVVDLIWGGVLAASVSTIAYFVANALGL